MGNLIESATWSAGVPYFEADAILTGGPDCPDNIPIQALTNRTVFLKKQIDDAVSGALNLGTASKWKTARSVSINGDATWTVTLDGSANVTAALTLANSGIVAGTYPVATFDAKGRATGGRALQSSDLPANAALTGTPTAPTAPVGTKNKQLANTEYVLAAIANFVGSAPEALDTLAELAAALGNDPHFATTMMNLIGQKADKATTLAGYGITDAAKASDMVKSVQGKRPDANGNIPLRCAYGFTANAQLNADHYGALIEGAADGISIAFPPAAAGEEVEYFAVTGNQTLTTDTNFNWGTVNGKSILVKAGYTIRWRCDGFSWNAIATNAADKAPMPVSDPAGTSIGAWRSISISSNSFVLPPGGTWAYYTFAAGPNTSNAGRGYTGVAAGGTVVQTESPLINAAGLCWRIK